MCVSGWAAEVVDADRAGHAQVQRQRPAAIERQQDPLGAAAGGQHRAPLQQRGKLLDRRRFDHALPVEMCYGDDLPTDDLRAKAARGVFNLW